MNITGTYFIALWGIISFSGSAAYAEARPQSMLQVFPMPRVSMEHAHKMNEQPPLAQAQEDLCAANTPGEGTENTRLIGNRVPSQTTKAWKRQGKLSLEERRALRRQIDAAVHDLDKPSAK